MSVGNAITAGIIYALTEVLALSGSGHLSVLNAFFDLRLTSMNLLFKAAVELAVMIALIVARRKEIDPRHRWSDWLWTAPDRKRRQISGGASAFHVGDGNAAAADHAAVSQSLFWTLGEYHFCRRDVSFKRRSPLYL